MKTNRIKSKTITALLVCVGSLVLGTSQAETIGYWRFEDGAYLRDSGPKNFRLSQEGTVAQVRIPGSGPGSAFYDPIPQTRTINKGAAEFGTTTERNRLYAEGSRYDRLMTATGPKSFTFEAMFHYKKDPSVNQYQTLGGRYLAFESRRVWYLRINEVSTEVEFVFSQDGEDATILGLGVNLTADKDYYLGFSFGATRGENLTLWTQNLTDGGSLQSVTVENTFGALAEAEWYMEIGGMASPGAERQMQSLIDEVRVSSGVLSREKLLATNP